MLSLHSGTLAFSTLGCPALDLSAALTLATAHGFGGLEVRALDGQLDLPACLTAAYGSPEKLAAVLRSQPVRIVALDVSLKLAENNPADFAALLALVPWAEALQVPYLRVFDGGTGAGTTELQAMAETLFTWRNLRRTNGWQTDVMVETHDSLFTTDAIQRLLALAPDTAILWDAHHTWKRGGEDPLNTWTALRPHIVHIHVKDSVSRPTPPLPYTYVPPGEGEFPARPLFDRLQREFNGTLSLEWERLWHPTLPPLEVAFDAAMKNGWWA